MYNPLMELRLNEISLQMCSFHDCWLCILRFFLLVGLLHRFPFVVNINETEMGQEHVDKKKSQTVARN